MPDRSQNKTAPLNTVMDEHGRESAVVHFALPGGTDQMFISPNQAIPVVFIPGIMGSPLLATGSNQSMWSGQGRWAWNPDSIVWMTAGFGYRKYYDRRKLLNPRETKALEPPDETDPSLLKKICKKSPVMTWQEARRRGWGTVMLSSYGEILLWLQTQLQHIFFQGQPHHDMANYMPEDPSHWGELKGYTPLTEEDLRNAAAWRFPVYAVGYNWMDSNATAAQRLKQRIEAIREDCRNRLRLKCDQVILITHSMGGLVARMYAKLNPQDVLGVIHGVQPAIGAATAYARVRTGWESNLDWTSPWGSLKNMIGAWALGLTGYEVSAVFAAGAGPLELLPNQNYGKGWLKIQFGRGNKAKTILNLPASNPYKEIYMEHNHWWRLIHPECLINPKEAHTWGNPYKIEWDKFTEQLDRAETFHQELGEYYHPKTFAHCGTDPGQAAWHRIHWQLESLREVKTGLWGAKPDPQAISQMKLIRDSMEGWCELQDPSTARPLWINRNGVGTIVSSEGGSYRAWLGGKDEPGDATVPSHSGLAPRPYVRFFAQLQGFEHQASYNHATVQAVTMYSLLKLAAEARPLA